MGERRAFGTCVCSPCARLQARVLRLARGRLLAGCRRRLACSLICVFLSLLFCLSCVLAVVSSPAIEYRTGGENSEEGWRRDRACSYAGGARCNRAGAPGVRSGGAPPPLATAPAHPPGPVRRPPTAAGTSIVLFDHIKLILWPTFAQTRPRSGSLDTNKPFLGRICATICQGGCTVCGGESEKSRSWRPWVDPEGGRILHILVYICLPMFA